MKPINFFGLIIHLARTLAIVGFSLWNGGKISLSRGGKTFN